jgi:hypothetical protein
MSCFYMHICHCSNTYSTRHVISVAHALSRLYLVLILHQTIMCNIFENFSSKHVGFYLIELIKLSHVNKSRTYLQN